MPEGIFGAFTSAQKAGQEFGQEIQTKSALQEAYAGQIPEDMQNPIKQATMLNSAAGILASKGLASSAYKLQKQAGDLSNSVQTQQLNELKVNQGKLEYAGQMLPGATTDADLNSAFSQITDTLAQAQIQRVIRSSMPFEEKKQKLGLMAETVDTQLKAQSIALTTAKNASEIKNREEDNIRADRKQALAVLQLDIDTGKYKDTPEDRAAIDKRTAEILGGGYKTPVAGSTGIPSAKIEGVNLTQEQANLEKAGIPIISGIRSAQKQESLKDHKDAKGNWVTKEGIPVADNSLHLSGKGIDTGPLNKDQRQILARAGWYQPIPKEDPNHWEKLDTEQTDKKPETTEKPVATATNKKTGDEISLPVASPDGGIVEAGGAKPLSRKGAGKGGQMNERLAWGILEASTQANQDIVNLVQMPVGSELSAFSGMAGKSGSGFTSSLANATARKLSSDEQRIFQQNVTGFETHMARALGGGYAASSTAKVMEAYKAQVAQEGDNPIIMASFLARAKQELQLLGKAYEAHPGTTPAMAKQNKELMDKLDKYVTWSVADVNKALNATGKPSIADMSRGITGKTTSGTSQSDMDLINKYSSTPTTK